MTDETEGGAQMENPGNDWTAQTLAGAAGVTDAYIRHLCILGTIQGEKFGYQWRIPYVEGVRWMEQRKRGT